MATVHANFETNSRLDYCNKIFMPNNERTYNYPVIKGHRDQTIEPK